LSCRSFDASLAATLIPLWAYGVLHPVLALRSGISLVACGSVATPLCLALAFSRRFLRCRGSQGAAFLPSDV
jgi:hypothetical protein